MRLKVKPSAKIKRRYLLIEGSKDSVEKVVLDYIGILGWAKAAPFFVRSTKAKTIVAIDRKALDDVRAAFELSKNKVKILKVSGTLKGLK